MLGGINMRKERAVLEMFRNNIWELGQNLIYISDKESDDYFLNKSNIDRLHSVFTDMMLALQYLREGEPESAEDILIKILL